jgi:hypothetical protein
VLKSLNAGTEERLDLAVQIKKLDTQKPGQFFTHGRLANATDPCQENAHCCS